MKLSTMRSGARSAVITTAVVASIIGTMPLGAQVTAAPIFPDFGSSGGTSATDDGPAVGESRISGIVNLNFYDGEWPLRYTVRVNPNDSFKDFDSRNGRQCVTDRHGPFRYTVDRPVRGTSGSEGASRQRLDLWMVPSQTLDGCDNRPSIQEWGIDVFVQVILPSGQLGPIKGLYDRPVALVYQDGNLHVAGRTNVDLFWQYD